MTGMAMGSQLQRWFGIGIAVCAFAAVLAAATPAQAEPQIDDDDFLTVLSIGDSFIAGTGTEDYYGGQGPGAPDVEEAQRYPGSGANCYQSHSAYPAQYVQMLNDNGFPAALYQAACHGAHVDDLDEQFATIPDGLKSRADIVLISAGGNDVGFNALVGLCILGLPDWVPGVGDQEITTCDAALDRAENDETRGFDRTMADLRAATAAVAAAVPEDTRVVLVGYPNLNSPDCGGRGQDRVLALQAQHDDELVRIASDLSQTHGARFHTIHPTPRFHDRGPCYDPPPLFTRWMHRAVADEGESFHPTIEGAYQYADLIFDQQIHTELRIDPEPPPPPPEVWGATFHDQHAFRDAALLQPWDLNNVAAGQTGYLRFRFVNTGNTTWRSSGSPPLRLGTAEPHDSDSTFYAGPPLSDSWLSSNRPTALQESQVLPGQIGTFVFPVRAPSNPGTYREHFQPVADGVTWFGPVVWRELTVSPNIGQYANTIVKWDGDSSTSWYVTPDLKRLWIPDGGTYQELQARGVGGPHVLAAATLDQLPDQHNRWVASGATWTGNRTMRRGMSVWSTDGRYRFSMQNDGNLVLYGPSGRALWATSWLTSRWRDQRFVVFQTDGNLVTYTDSGRAIWWSGSGGRGADRFVIQTDGNMVIYRGSTPIWHSGTAGRR